MSDTAWRSLTSRLGWLIAVTAVIAAAIFALLAFHITASEPPFDPNGTFVDNILVEFEDAQANRIQEQVSSLLFAVAFVGVAMIGVALRRAMDPDDPRSVVLAVSFLVAGILGVAAQLLFIGAAEVASSPEYCDCGFLAEELVSRKMIMNVVFGIQFWLTDGFVVLFAIGLLAFAGLAGAAGWVPAGLAVFSRVLAVLGLISVVWGHVGVPLLIEAGTEFDFGLVGAVITLVVGGILIPLWAAWLARAASAGESGPEPGPEPVA
jgi:hypothetical protein